MRTVGVGTVGSGLRSAVAFAAQNEGNYLNINQLDVWRPRTPPPIEDPTPFSRPLAAQNEDPSFPHDPALLAPEK